jgi:hypothetical protein
MTRRRDYLPDVDGRVRVYDTRRPPARGRRRIVSPANKDRPNTVAPVAGATLLLDHVCVAIVDPSQFAFNLYSDLLISGQTDTSWPTDSSALRCRCRLARQEDARLLETWLILEISQPLPTLPLAREPSVPSSWN